MPETLTADQAKELAEFFSAWADAVVAYKNANRSRLTPEDVQDLNEFANKLINLSEACINLATELTLDDLEESLAKIRAAINTANEAVQTIEDVKKAISVFAAVINVGTAVVSKDPSAIVTTVKELYAEVEGVRKKPKGHGHRPGHGGGKQA
jgi:DNA repair ATPase RecN